MSTSLVGSGAVRSEELSARLGRLAVVLVGLGLASLLPELALWVGRVRELASSGWPELGRWGSALRSTEPGPLAWRAWPIAVGVMLGVTRWPHLLLGVSATFAVLGLDELGTAAIPMVDRLGLAGRSWMRPESRWVAASVARLALGALELAAAVWAWRLRRTWRRVGRPDRGTTSQPPAIAGRMLGVGALVFLLLAGSSKVWTLYERFALRSPGLRTWLSDPGDRGRRLLDPLERELTAAFDDFRDARGLAAQKRYAKARRAYIWSVRELERLATVDPRGRTFAEARSLSLNNLAWMLATCDDPNQRDPEEAVSAARMALSLTPGDGNIWNTLAVSEYRAGHREKSAEAFERSMSLRAGGDAYDWYFLAMLAAGRDEPEEAQSLFDRAEHWRHNYQPGSNELRRFRVEAAEVLGLSLPPEETETTELEPPGE